MFCDMTNQIIAYYLMAINIVTFFVYGIDKWKAKKSLWHIREASLLMLAVLGGSIGAWLGTLPYIDIVEEALCFGWIDSTLKKLPDGRLAQRLSPRRKGSHWTELNKERCRDLESRGLMTDSGRMALERTT